MPRNRRTSNLFISLLTGIANIFGRIPSHERMPQNQEAAEAVVNETTGLIPEDNEADAPKLLVSGLEVPEFIPVRADVTESTVAQVGIAMAAVDNTNTNETDRDVQEVDDSSETQSNENEKNTMDEVLNIMHLFSTVVASAAEIKEQQAKHHMESKENFERINKSSQEIQQKQIRNQDDLLSSMSKVGEQAQGLHGNLNTMKRSQDQYHQQLQDAIGRVSAQVIDHTTRTMKNTESELKVGMTQLGYQLERGVAEISQEQNNRHGQLQNAMGHLVNKADEINVKITGSREESSHRHAQIFGAIGEVRNQARDLAGMMNAAREEQGQRHGQLFGAVGEVRNQARDLAGMMNAAREEQGQRHGQLHHVITQSVETILQLQGGNHDVSQVLLQRLIELAEQNNRIQAHIAAQQARMVESMFKAPVKQKEIFKIDYDERHTIFIFKDSERLKLLAYKSSESRVLTPDEARDMASRYLGVNNLQALYETIQRRMVVLTPSEVAALPQFTEDQFYLLSSSSSQVRLGR